MIPAELHDKIKAVRIVNGTYKETIKILYLFLIQFLIHKQSQVNFCKVFFERARVGDKLEVDANSDPN